MGAPVYSRDTSIQGTQNLVREKRIIIFVFVTSIEGTPVLENSFWDLKKCSLVTIVTAFKKMNCRLISLKINELHLSEFNTQHRRDRVNRAFTLPTLSSCMKYMMTAADSKAE